MSLVRWVEAGSAPVSIVASRYDQQDGRMTAQAQRPICAYRQLLQCMGGAPSGFRCMDRERGSKSAPAQRHLN